MERIDAADLAEEVASCPRVESVLGKGFFAGEELNLLSCTLTIRAFFLRQIEQSHIVSSGKSVSISKRTVPQWQLPSYFWTWRVLMALMEMGGLTFDVRGGPLAGRPLDGGVRPRAIAGPRQRCF
jgi:hypothetical protein